MRLEAFILGGYSVESAIDKPVWSELWYLHGGTVIFCHCTKRVMCGDRHEAGRPPIGRHFGLYKQSSVERERARWSASNRETTDLCKGQMAFLQLVEVENVSLQGPGFVSLAEVLLHC